MWAVGNIAPANMVLYPLYYDIISLISLKINQMFLLLFALAEYQIVFCNFKIQNYVRITEGLDNGDSDNQGPTVVSEYELQLNIE